MIRAGVIDSAILNPASTATVLASPTFPGAVGAAWPTADWTVNVGNPVGTVFQDGAGYGQLRANQATAWNASQPTAYLKTVNATNLEVTGQFKTPGTNGYVPQFWPGIGLGVTAATASATGSSGAYSTGITVIYALGNGSWSVAAPDGTSLSGDIPQNWVQQTDYGFRIRRTVAGGIASVSARVWVASAAEPTAWGYTGTSSLAAAITAGSLGFQTGQGGDTTDQRPIKYRNLVITNAS